MIGVWLPRSGLVQHRILRLAPSLAQRPIARPANTGEPPWIANLSEPMFDAPRDN